MTGATIHFTDHELCDLLAAISVLTGAETPDDTEARLTGFRPSLAAAYQKLRTGLVASMLAEDPA